MYKFIKMSNFLKIIIGLSLVLLSVLFFLYEPDITVEEAKETLLKENSQFVEIDGLDVHYVREGTGFPFLLVHGTSSMLHTWDDWSNLLQDKYEVIRMDIPAFGLTGPRADNDYSIEMYVQFINQFVEKIGVDSFHIAGNSLGGEIVWHYALHYPEKVAKMVLISPAGIQQKDKRLHTLAFRLARMERMTGLVKNFGTKFLVKRAVKDVYFDNSRIEEEMVEKYYKATLREGNRGAVISRINQISSKPEEILQKIQNPTLVLWGTHDVLINVLIAEKFRNNLPNGEVIIYPNVGHVAMEEIPEETIEATLKFLKD